MDWLKPGLPAKTIREIRATNTISTRLLHQLQKLNEETAFFLQTAQIPDEPTEIQQIFQNFYFLVGASALNKVPKFPVIELKKLQKIAADLDNATPQNESDKSLVHIIDKYLVVLAAHEMTNQLIFKTIVLRKQSLYWTDVKLLAYRKLTYGIQTLPIRVYDFACRGVHNTVFVKEENKGLYGRLKSALAALWTTFSRMGAQIGAHLNKNFVLRDSKMRFLRVPISFIENEVRGKVKAVLSQLDVHYEQLGLIINSLPVDMEFLGKILECEVSRSVVIQRIIEKGKDDSEYKLTSPPGLLSRYWLFIALLVNYGPSTSSSIYQNRFEIVNWIRLNLVDTVVGFWKNWVVKPVWDMLAILRADDSMTITSKESLQSDLNSLERMVVDFMKDNHMEVNPAQVHHAVGQGDLTMMMSQYEKEIKTPYKLIIQGLLIRSILIQIQKTKVDGAIAIGGIDKLLKLQQLLFGMLSVLPSLFILYQLNQALKKEGSSSKESRIVCLKSLNQVGALVNREVQSSKLVGDGKLFVEIVNLTLLLKNIVPLKLRDDWLKDLNELMVASTADSDLATRVVERIWNMYSPFFRRGID